MTTNGREIWPAELAVISAAGPSQLGDEGLAILHAFALEVPPGDADVIAQYSIDDIGFIDTNVFQGAGDRWTEYDPEDGSNYDRTFAWQNVSVVMARDRMTNMVALRLEDAIPATKKMLKAAPSGSLATAEGGPGLLYKSHGEWIDLDSGVDESWKGGKLLEAFESVGLVWVAPDGE